MSILDVHISLLTYMATMYLMSGHVPHNTFPTQDGHIIIACIGDAFFERFLAVVDRPELRKPEYLKQPAHYADRLLIENVIHEELILHPSACWLDKLRAARVPCGPVNDFGQALSDSQVLARDRVVEVPLPGGDTVRMPGIPMKFSDSGTPAFPGTADAGARYPVGAGGIAGLWRRPHSSPAGNLRDWLSAHGFGGVRLRPKTAVSAVPPAGLPAPPGC